MARHAPRTGGRRERLRARASQPRSRGSERRARSSPAPLDEAQTTRSLQSPVELAAMPKCALGHYRGALKMRGFVSSRTDSDKNTVSAHGLPTPQQLAKPLVARLDPSD